MTRLTHQDFQEAVWTYYHAHGRHMPWRQPEADGSFDPYKIMVSEVMLQQTQVTRVIPKYEAFLIVFPTAEALAGAPLSRVLEQWSGLGYNRRAKFLHQAAKQIVEDVKHPFPATLNALSNLPGIGMHTAGAIMNYAYNQATVFLETNIRTVYIYHFYADYHDLVTDQELLPLVEATMDREHPREWFWALMDYGAHLKATVGNLNRQSKQYNKQSAFQGSKRQVRGQVLQALLGGPQAAADLAQGIDDTRLPAVLDDLCREGLITQQGQQYSLAN